MKAPREDLVRTTQSLRSQDDGNTLVGYAAVFNTWTTIDSWEGTFLERLDPKAFDQTLADRADQIRVLFQHGMDPQIGDKPLGKPRVMKPDGRGLWVEVPLDPTSYNDDLKALLRSGALDGMSFRMSVLGEQWNLPETSSTSNPGKLPERTIESLELYEFGPVTFPAYASTSAGVRGRRPSLPPLPQRDPVDGPTAAQRREMRLAAMSDSKRKAALRSEVMDRMLAARPRRKASADPEPIVARTITPPPVRKRDPWDIDDMPLFMPKVNKGRELRARALTAVERMDAPSDRVRETLTRMVERADSVDGRLAEHVLCTSSPAYLTAFSKLVMMHGHPGLLDADDRRAVARAMSLTDGQGGYLVPAQLDPVVTITSDGSLNEIRNAARQVIAIGDQWKGVTSAAPSWAWKAEGAEAADASTAFGEVEIPVHTAEGWIPISLEAFDDAANVADEVSRMLAQGKDDLEAVAFATGSGNGEPAGIVTGLANNTGSVINSKTTDTFALADVYALDDALPGRYRARASWMANSKTYSATRQFDTDGGATLWAQLAAGGPHGLLGKPVLEAEAMDGVINAGQENYNLVFGDLSSAYVIADRIGVTIAFIPTAFGPNGRPVGQRGWLAYYRAGADVVNPGAARLLDVT